MSLTHIINVLNRTIVAEFYRMNSGFFLLFGALAFGFMSEVEHRALAQFFVSGPSTVLIPVGVWLLYTLKIIRFNDAQVRLPTNGFLFTAQFLPRHQLLFVCVQSFVLQLFPAIAYGLYLILVAWTLPDADSIIIIALALLTYIGFGAMSISRALRNPLREFKASVLSRFFDRHLVRPLVQIYVEWLLRKKPVMVTGTKIVTCVLLFGVCTLYEYEDFDWRLLAMAVTFCGIANVFIAFQMVTFEHTNIGWIKNIPLSTSRRFLTFMTVLVIFILPEVVVLARNFPAHLYIQWLPLHVAYLVSLMGFFLGFLHTSSSPLDSFTKRSFWIFVALIILILFNIPLIALSLINITTGYALFKKYYYLFEYSTT